MVCVLVCVCVCVCACVFVCMCGDGVIILISVCVHECVGEVVRFCVSDCNPLSWHSYSNSVLIRPSTASLKELSLRRTLPLRLLLSECQSVHFLILLLVSLCIWNFFSILSGIEVLFSLLDGTYQQGSIFFSNTGSEDIELMALAVSHPNFVASDTQHLGPMLHLSKWPVPVGVT